MRFLKDVKMAKVETIKNMRGLEGRINELKLELCEQREFLRELEDLEKMFFEKENGLTVCPDHNYCGKKSGAKKRGKREKPSDIAQKFKTLSKSEQANLLQLLTLGDE